LTKKIFKQAKKFLPLIGISIFVYLIYRLGFQDIIKAILSIPPIYIILSVLLTIPLLIIRNYAWQLILKEQKINIGFFQSLKIFLIGFFYGSFTPGYSGQLMRMPYLNETTGEPYGKLFINTVIETTIHTLSLYGMMIVGAILVIEMLPKVSILVLAWVLFVAIIIIYFIKRERGERFFSILIQHLAPQKFKSHFTAFADTFYDDFPRARKLIIPAILGIFTWVIVFSQEYIVVLALGLDIPYVLFLVLYPIVNTAGFMPITFAGLGTRELTAIFLFSTLFNAPAEKVFVLSLVGFVITDVFIGFIGFIFSLTEAKKRGKSLESIFK
jgi:uncharacterized protein (TIRG00374 family)